jgi:hypothetical protein
MRNAIELALIATGGLKANIMFRVGPIDSHMGRKGLGI